MVIFRSSRSTMTRGTSRAWDGLSLRTLLWRAPYARGRGRVGSRGVVGVFVHGRATP